VIRTLARGLLWFAVIWWGIWFGGQLFNALMVIPHFSADPPESLAAWSAMRADYLADFLLLFNPSWIALALGGSLARGWRFYGRGRNWAIGSLFAAVLSASMVVLWMAPEIARLVNFQDPSVSLLQVQSALHRWTIVNWARLLIEFDGFVCALLALATPPEV
jgi:hypothetical protein